jgi:hypothetical protein
VYLLEPCQTQRTHAKVSSPLRIYRFSCNLYEKRAELDSSYYWWYLDRYKTNKKPTSPGSLKRKGKDRENDEDEDEDYINENADSGTHVSGWSPLHTETPRATSSNLLGQSFRNLDDQEMSFLPGQSVGDTLPTRPGAMQLGNGSGTLAMPLSEERTMDASHLQQTPGDTATPAHLASYYISQDWLDDAWLSQLLPTQSQPVAAAGRGEINLITTISMTAQELAGTCFWTRHPPPLRSIRGR